MALDSTLRGFVSGNGAEVNTSGELKVAVNKPVMFFESDAGAVTGTPMNRSPQVSIQGRLRAGLDFQLFADNFCYTAQNTSNWYYVFATMTMTLPGGYLNIGTVQGTAYNHGALFKTHQVFKLSQDQAIKVGFTYAQNGAYLVANEIFQFGLGSPTAVTTNVTDGVYFELTSAGLIGVLNYNGTKTQTGVLESVNANPLGQYENYYINITDRDVEFRKEGVLLATISTPTNQGQPIIADGLCLFMMKRCIGAVASTNTIRVRNTVVLSRDLFRNIDFKTQQALSGLSGFVGQNGQTQGKTAQWVNNTAPTAAVMTNTTAALGTGLGGFFAVNPLLATYTDGIVCSYQNPVPTAALSGRNLVVYGVKVKGAVSGTLTGGPVTYQYAIAFGHSAVSIATAESASFATGTSRAPRIVPVGYETYAAGAATGVLGQGEYLSLRCPIVVRPGEFLALIARNIATVTTAGTITLGVTFDAVWE